MPEPALTIASFLLDPSLTQACTQGLRGGRYELEAIDPSRDPVAVLEERRDGFDAVLLQQGVMAAASLQALAEQGMLLPAVVIGAATGRVEYHDAEVHLPADQLEQLSYSLDAAVSRVLRSGRLAAGQRPAGPGESAGEGWKLDNRLKDRCRQLKPLYWQKGNDMHRYVWRINPDLWYNATDQLKAGISFTGNYAQRKHRIDAFAWLNTRPAFNPGSEDPWRSVYSFSFNYANRIGRLFEYNLRHEWLDGLISSEAGISKRWGSNRAYANYRFMQRRDYRYVFGGDLEGQFGNLPGWWDASRWSEGRNASFNFGLFHDYRYYNGTGLMHLFARSSGPFSQTRYGWVGLEAVNRNTLGKLDINTRFFGQFSGDDLPMESALYTAGDNPENQWHNSKFTRADWGGSDGRLGQGSAGG
jgi:hypothetical protein